VIDGVGRKRGSKNLPKNRRTYISLILVSLKEANFGAEKVTRSGKKGAHRKGSSAKSQPLQSPPLQNIVVAQPATNLQPVTNFQAPVQPWLADFNLSQGVVRATCPTLPMPTVYYHTVAGPMVSHQLTPQATFNHQANYQAWSGPVAGAQGTNNPQCWG
jgi:hypothetical protein